MTRGPSVKERSERDAKRAEERATEPYPPSARGGECTAECSREFCVRGLRLPLPCCLPTVVVPLAGSLYVALHDVDRGSGSFYICVPGCCICLAVSCGSKLWHLPYFLQLQPVAFATIEGYHPMICGPHMQIYYHLLREPVAREFFTRSSTTAVVV